MVTAPVAKLSRRGVSSVSTTTKLLKPLRPEAKPATVLPARKNGALPPSPPGNSVVPESSPAAAPRPLRMPKVGTV